MALLRNTWKTDVYSVSIAGGKRVLLFSDEGMNLELKGSGAVSNAGKAYMPATWRERISRPYPGIRTQDGIFEISLDGSKHFRRILGLQQNQPPPVLNPQATKAVFNTFVNGKWVVSIYTVPDWKLLETWNLAQLRKSHCPDCDPLSYGWLADGKRLYFVLGLVGEESAGHPEIRDTPYIVSESGADLGAIPPEVGTLRLPGHVSSPYVDRRFLGQLPDGSYLLVDFAVPKGGPFNNPQPYLVVSNPVSKFTKQFRLKVPIGRAFISPSGKYLAYILDSVTPDFRSEQHLWIFDLDSGTAKELYSTPPTQRPSSVKPNEFLSILGWLNRN